MGNLILLKKSEEPVVGPKDAFGIYLIQSGKQPLLTKKKELDLSIRIEQSHKDIFYTICDYDRENQEHFGLVAIKGRIRQRYSYKKREEILEEGVGCLKENETYRVISELEELLEKPKHREEIYGQMFQELYFSEESLGQINRDSKYNDDDEMKVNSYREVIRETATNLIPEIENNIFFYENEVEKASSESSKNDFREKINESGKVKENLQSQLKEERKLRERFTNSNLRLVISIAKKFMDRGVSLEELVQEGNFGLMKAVDGFDYTKNYKFSTYATWWIKQFVNRGIASYGKNVNIPVHVHEFNAQCYGAEIELIHILNRKPKTEELAQYMYDGTLTDKAKENMTVKDLIKAIEKNERVSQPECHLDSVYKNRNTRNDFSEEGISVDKTKVMVELVRKTPGLEEPYVEKQLSEFVRRALTTLTPREEKIIRKRFGIGEDRTYTLEEIKDDFNVTRERIRQLEAKALKKLRLPSRSEKLKIFWD